MRLPPCFSIELWIASIARSRRSTAAYYTQNTSISTQLTQHTYNSQRPGTHLVRRVRAEDVQRGRDELRLDRHGVGALLLARAQRALDRVDARGRVAGELDVRAQLDRLRRQAARDRAREDREGGGRDGRGEGGEDGVGLAVGMGSNSGEKRISYDSTFDMKAGRRTLEPA
jgi:hypothetical protein